MEELSPFRKSNKENDTSPICSRVQRVDSLLKMNRPSTIMNTLSTKKQSIDDNDENVYKDMEQDKDRDRVSNEPLSLES